MEGGLDGGDGATFLIKGHAEFVFTGESADGRPSSAHGSEL